MKKITIFSKLLTLAVMCFIVLQVNAQVTLIYPDATPAANYATIQAAYDAIDFTPHPGAHTIQIENSYVPSAETYPIQLSALFGASATNKVTIKPATGAKIILGPANKTVIATVTDLTFSSTSTSVDLSGIITSGDISYLSGNVTSTDINISTTSGTNSATITGGTLANGTYYISGNPNIPVRASFIYSGNAAVTLTANATATATSTACKATPSTNSYVSGIGTYASTAFYNVSGISGNVITVPVGTFNATSKAGNKLFVGPAQTCAVKFIGAKYVTIDGVSRTDANTGLTIQNPNSIYAQTVFFAGNSQYNTVTNCILRGANHSGAWNNGFQGTVYFQAGSGATCSYNTIDNNDICDMNDPNIPYPIAAIQMTAAGGTNTNQTISNNNIYNISNQYAGNGTCTFMQFGSESAAVGHSVLNNKFYWTAPTTFSAAAINFINVGTLGLGHKFEGNTIGYASSTASGTADITFLGSGGTIYGTSNLKNFTCKNNTVANLKITGTTGAKTFVALQFPAASSGAVANADNCYGNIVQNIEFNSNGGAGTFYGIFISVAPIYNLDVKKNIVKNIVCQSSAPENPNTIYGIFSSFGSSGTLAINCIENEVSNLTAGKAGSTAYNNITAFMSGGMSNIFEKNLIYNLNSITNGHTAGVTSTFSSSGASGQKNIVLADATGMQVGDLITGTGVPANATISGISGNTITLSANLTAQAAGSYTTALNTFFIKGMRFATSKTDGITVKNNIFRLGSDVTSNVEISAIIDEGLSSNGHPFYIYHNSVFIGGGTGLTLTRPSHCFNHSAGANYGSIVVKNNIFCNARVGGAVNQIYNTMSLPVINGSSNNLYKYGSLFATVTTTTPATYVGLDDWNSDRVINSLNEDTNSKNQLDPQFVDATATTPDMHVSSSSPANENGIALAAVTDDFVGAIRSNYVTAETTNADMGAYVISNSTALDSKVSTVSVVGISNNIRFTNLSGKTASVYTFAGQLLKSVLLTSDNVTIPAAKGLYLVNVNGEVTKVMVK